MVEAGCQVTVNTRWPTIQEAHVPEMVGASPIRITDTVPEVVT